MKPWHWLLLGAVGYAAYKLLGKMELWEKLSFSLVGVTPGLSRQGVYIDAKFLLDNSTAHSLTVDKIDGWILYQGQQLARIITDQPQTIAPGTSSFTVTLRPKLGGAVDMIRKLANGPASFDKSQFMFDGAVTVMGITAQIKKPLEW